MTSADSINQDDRDRIRRLSIGLFLGFCIVAAVTRLDLLYSHKFFDVTGKAEWIWAPHELSSHLPQAFFATRELELPPQRHYTRLKIAVDPEYTLWFNGKEIAARRVGEPQGLDVYDLSEMARTGRNRLVVAVRSVDGVGGLLASVDIAEETENYVVTDGDWRIYRRWRDDLPQRDPADVAWTPPMILGRPPVGRWNYLTRQAAAFEKAPKAPEPPRQSYSFITKIPRVRVVGGVAVAVNDPIRATVYDFGTIDDARARLTIAYDNGVSRIVDVRFANAPQELKTVEGDVQPFVFAPGERTVVDPEVRHFRYVMVYGSQASAEREPVAAGP